MATPPPRPMDPARHGKVRRAVRAAVCSGAVVVASVLHAPGGAGGVAAAAGPPAKAPDASATALPPAADAATDLAAAEKLYADLDYDRANLMAARVIAGKGLSHGELTRGLRLLALTDATLGREEQAREEFIELLTYAPDFQVDPNLGPRVTAPFLEARGYWRSQAEKPGMEATATVHSEGQGTLRVVTRDPTHIVKSGTVGFRWGSSVAYVTLPLAVSGPGDGVAFDIPERPANLARFDYYAQVFDERGNAVMEVGNPTSPKSVIVDAPKGGPITGGPEKKSLFASPIFWAVAGVVVAGAATTTYFLARPKAATGATLTGGADCGSVASGGAPTGCH